MYSQEIKNYPRRTTRRTVTSDYLRRFQQLKRSGRSSRGEGFERPEALVACRFMKMNLILALVAPAAIVFTPYASADVLPLSPKQFAPNELQYLQELHYDDVPLSDDLMAVDVGWEICEVLKRGYSEHAVEVIWERPPDEITHNTMDTYIKSAVTYLCPQEEEGRPQLEIPPEMRHA